MIMTMDGRSFERIGDNAVEIGDQTAVVVTRRFRELSEASHVAAP